MESPRRESSTKNYHTVDDETILLKMKKEELIKVKEELKQAKDKATQSWLDSRPLIDELERLKQGLARAEKRYNMSNDDTLIFDLQSELEIITKSVRSKKKEEVNAAKMVNEMKYNRDLDQLRDEMEGLKLTTNKKRQSKLKLKRTLRLRRQRLRSLQLALAAARKEAEAYGASAAEATRYIDLYNSEITMGGTRTTTATVRLRLSHEEYQALKTKAEENNSVAIWRVSVAEGEKLAAESSRDLALAKLKEVKAGKLRLMMRERKVDINPRVDVDDVNEDQINNNNNNNNNNKNNNNNPRMAAIAKQDQRPVRPRRGTKARNNNKKKVVHVNKKKKSIFQKIKFCFVQNIFKKLFG